LYITDLQITDFRNYTAAEIEPCQGTNLIIGRNAQGKTNLVEAICYLSAARSFRGAKDAELVRFGANGARIKAKLVADRAYTLDVTVAGADSGLRREIYVNGVKKRKTSELLGILQTVLFCPEDLSLVKDGAAARRKFVDTALCQLRPNYAVWLSEYNKLILHKTRILKDREKYPALLDTLDDFTARMCAVAAQLIPYRAWFVRELAGYAAVIHSDISAGAETLTIDYKTVSTVADPAADAETIYYALWQHYIAHKNAEIASASVLSGIHKDDLLIAINGLPARQFASQGQTRSAALAMKLGQRDLFTADTGHCPVLILDDVLSELDETRRAYILKGIDRGQVFITACDWNMEAQKVFTVVDGTVQ